ncbi:filamentous hemagglutinin N-terminal domain-containing protein, partial [Mitsuokella sp. AF33-22]|uniref:two-partner secretion domain-containing protein n=1 Tax=Mitsuokella sp. AF33-22 TaxID=2292047 RepID=UPI000E4AB06D
MTRKIRRTWHRKTAALAATMMAMSFGGMAYAMPQGETIRSGHGEITRQDKEMTVNQDTKHLAIDWKGFDINNDERVRFNQPDAASIALNRVTGDAKTFIDGSLTANGQVFVINPNGVLFGQNASVDVGSLVASTARVSDSQMEAFGNGDGTLNLELADDSTAKVINEGTIRAEGGLVALHAAAVENSGTIANEGGKIALAAAKNINLSADTAGKLNFTVDGTLAKASTLNSGVLKADGGYIVMTAKQAGDVMSTVVNNTGTIEAKTLRQNEKGEILLDGGESGIVEISGTIDASGMEAGQSAGQIKAIGAETHLKDGAALLARGTVDGGLIETSGDYLEIGDTVNIDAAGETGKAGEWLLDPLDVVISDSKPSGSTDADSDNSYNEVQTADANKTSWVNSNTVNTLLSRGTSVKIQSVDKNKAATITVDSEIKKSGEKDADTTTLTLEAQSNVTINKSIKSTVGKLNVVLNSDIDGNGVGAVLINADIDTNGGSFTSGSGGNVELESYTWGGKTYYRVAGTADPTKGTVGTYFGNGGSTAGRTINTNGGAVNLYGDVAVGLNGGNLILDTNGGAVKVIGSIDSGNAYTIYSMDDTAKWDELVNKIKSSYSNYAWNSKVKSYYESISSQNKIAQSGEGYSYYDFQGNLRYYIVDWSNLSASEKEKVAKYYVANNWDFAKILAQGNTEGGAKTGDTYLATITTALENSLTSQGKENPLFVGGRGSGNSRNPVDNTYRDGYYWITGPEGLVTNANGTKGTKFARNDGTPTENYYANWNNGKSNITGETTKEPNNSGPYVSVGFGTASNWDDVKSSAGTTKGFVQEKNLAHSGLVINSNGGSVDLKGNVGHSVALSKLAITSTGTVNIGGGTNQSGATLSGIVHVDNNVDITGNGVTVGDRITSDAGHVNVTSDGNILVHGITAADKIKLVSTGESGDITIDDYGTTNNGALITKSTANDAVIIDARGTDGSFHNATDATKAANAITTGTGGNWQVYSASPDRDTFGTNGTNLNSETTALWHASSTGDNGLYAYAAENTNKYIFQVQPTITVKADDQTKTYGDEADVTAYTTTATASFTGRNGTYSVSDEKFTPAFQEGNLKNRYTGEIEFSSEGAAAEKTRMDGDINKTSSDNARPYFVIKAEGQNLAGKEGYAVTTANGTLEILRRDANISGTGTQTYGNSDISWTTTASNLKNNDQVGTVTIKEVSAYTENQKGRTTADAGTYENSAAFGSILNEKGEDASINYNLTGTGTIQVNKAKLSIETDGFEKVYGDVSGVQEELENAATIKGLTNGDGEAEMKLNGTSNALITVGDEVRTNNVLYDNDTKTYDGYEVKADLSGLSDELRAAINKNYEIDDKTSKTGKAVLKKKGITLITKNIETTYGDGNAIRDQLNNKLLSLDGLVSWDKESDVLNELTPDVSVNMTDSEASPYKLVNGERATDASGNFYTNNANEHGYSITTAHYSPAQNYEVIGTKEGFVKVKKADLQVEVGNATTTYGTPFDENLYTYTYSNLVNGDTAEMLNAELKVSPKYTNTGDGTGGRATQNFGEYSLTIKPSAFNSYLKNYNVKNVLSGVSTVNRAPYTITVGDIRNITYGDYKTLGTALRKNSVGTISGLTNGDEKDFESTFHGTSDALLYINKKWYTNDVNTDGYAINPELSSQLQDILAKNYRLVSEDPGRVYLNKAKLQVNIGNAETVYGTKFDEDEYSYNYSTETGKSLVNGDTKDSLAQGLGEIKYDNDAALDGKLTGIWTKDVGNNYPLTFAAKTANAFHALNNYDVSIVDGKAIVTPYKIKSSDFVN